MDMNKRLDVLASCNWSAYPALAPSTNFEPSFLISTQHGLLISSSLGQLRIYFATGYKIISKEGERVLILSQCDSEVYFLVKK